MVEKTYNDVFVLLQTKKKSWFVFPKLLKLLICLVLLIIIILEVPLCILYHSMSLKRNILLVPKVILVFDSMCHMILKFIISWVCKTSY